MIKYGVSSMIVGGLIFLAGFTATANSNAGGLRLLLGGLLIVLGGVSFAIGAVAWLLFE